MVEGSVIINKRTICLELTEHNDLYVARWSGLAVSGSGYDAHQAVAGLKEMLEVYVKIKPSGFTAEQFEQAQAAIDILGSLLYSYPWLYKYK